MWWVSTDQSVTLCSFAASADVLCLEAPKQPSMDTAVIPVPSALNGFGLLEPSAIPNLAGCFLQEIVDMLMGLRL